MLLQFLYKFTVINKNMKVFFFRYVQLHRTIESMSLGIILSESKPVSIHSVITGKHSFSNI